MVEVQWIAQKRFLLLVVMAREDQMENMIFVPIADILYWVQMIKLNQVQWSQPSFLKNPVSQLLPSQLRLVQPVKQMAVQ